MGIALTMWVRILNTESKKKITPAQNTAPNATGQATCMPMTTEKVKNAFSPIPGATRMGLRA